MDIEGINDKRALCGIGVEFADAVEIDEKGKKDFVCGRAVLEDAEKVGVERDGGDIAGMKGEGGGWCGYGGARCGSEGVPDGGVAVDVEGSGGGGGGDGGRGGELVVGRCDLSKQRREESEQVRRRVCVDIDRVRRRRRGRRLLRILWAEGGWGIGRRR